MSWNLRAEARGAIAALQEAAALDAWAARAVPLPGPGGADAGWLLPVCALHRDDADTIRMLSAWRDAAQSAYPTRFPVTHEGTRRWLATQVLDDPDRLLFLVADALGRPVGHVGLRLPAPGGGAVEADNVLRGEDRGRGLMGRAMRALEAWAWRETGADRITLRVLASNDHAVRFYQGLGYAVTGTQGLRWVRDGERADLVPAVAGSGEPDDAFLVMARSLVDVEPEPATIPTAGPCIGPREVARVTQAVRTGWNDRHADDLERFESAFAEFVGVPFALATSSCTGALHLALLALGIGAGDEVIVPEITWVATAAAVAYVSATPVFADVDALTWTMDPASVRRLMTPRTRAVVPVHLYGQAAPLHALRRLCDEFGVALVEDAAPALGTMIGDVPAGGLGDISCFSFQGAKMLVAGEGGMLVTADPGCYERARRLNDHGRRPGTFWIEELGWKYKMPNVAAALGLGQLERVWGQVERKRRIHDWYRQELEAVPGLRFQEPAEGTRPNHWMTSVWLDPSRYPDPSEFARRMRAAGVDTRPVFPPVSSYPIWGPTRHETDVAGAISPRALTLPSGVRLGHRSVVRAARALRAALVAG